MMEKQNGSRTCSMVMKFAYGKWYTDRAILLKTIRATLVAMYEHAAAMPRGLNSLFFMSIFLLEAGAPEDGVDAKDKEEEEEEEDTDNEGEDNVFLRLATLFSPLKLVFSEMTDPLLFLLRPCLPCFGFLVLLLCSCSG